MRENQSLPCPACGEITIAKRKAQMDGFRKTGEILACMLCGARLGEIEAEKAAAKADASRLTDLLGGPEPEAAPKLTRREGEGRFCRDCGHYLVHPFLSRCNLKECDVNPMDDCPEWRPKSSREKTEL